MLIRSIRDEDLIHPGDPKTRILHVDQPKGAMMKPGPDKLSEADRSAVMEGLVDHRNGLQIILDDQRKGEMMKPGTDNPSEADRSAVMKRLEDHRNGQQTNLGEGRNRNTAKQSTD